MTKVIGASSESRAVRRSRHLSVAFVADRYLFASARLVPKKNLPRLNAAYGKAINGRVATPDLVILGEGREQGAVEAAIAKGKLEGRVYLPGFRGYVDFPALFGLFEGFVHVSTSEQIGPCDQQGGRSGRAGGRVRNLRRDTGAPPQ